ncbi:terminase small subunit [Enterococcus termitis]
MIQVNKRHERFCTEYIIDYNATQAAIRSGYSEKTARSQGQRLSTKVDIKKRIQELQEEIQQQNIVSAMDVEEFLSKVMNGELEEEALLVVGIGEEASEVVKANKKLSAKDRIKANYWANVMRCSLKNVRSAEKSG